MTDVAARFWAKVDKDGPIFHPRLGPCWLWTASRNGRRGGYGQFRMNGHVRRAHLVAYELEIGPLPDQQIEHFCDAPHCVNPGHLYAGSARLRDQRIPVIDRLLDRVDVDEDGCWLWQGCLNRQGYGQITLEFGKNALTHRVAWEHFEGAVPSELELDHLCRVRACCNPGHLEPVTHAENVRRAEEANAA